MSLETPDVAAFHDLRLDYETSNVVNIPQNETGLRRICFLGFDNLAGGELATPLAVAKPLGCLFSWIASSAEEYLARNASISDATLLSRLKPPAAPGAALGFQVTAQEHEQTMTVVARDSLAADDMAVAAVGRTVAAEVGIESVDAAAEPQAKTPVVIVHLLAVRQCAEPRPRLTLWSFEESPPSPQLLGMHVPHSSRTTGSRGVARGPSCTVPPGVISGGGGISLFPPLPWVVITLAVIAIICVAEALAPPYVAVRAAAAALLLVTAECEHVHKALHPHPSCFQLRLVRCPQLSAVLFAAEEKMQGQGFGHVVCVLSLGGGAWPRRQELAGSPE
ncbi:hypothetical protein Taro_027867 [Colocasia esculenta]|uniref:Uncharacterized protein n=1 Tax=Colocasia esculenta TaxID=4460 RepID=A0A843VNQ9_COLES|nr:hypothetical protein [Colocasia esculenta]